MKYLTGLVLFFGWVGGVVLAQGFWSTLFAVCIPFWSWYLVIEKCLAVLKIIP